MPGASSCCVLFDTMVRKIRSSSFLSITDDASFTARLQSILTNRLQHFPAPRPSSGSIILRACSGSNTPVSASKVSCPEAAAFTPGLTMGELKTQLAIAFAARQNQERHGQAVEQNDTHNKQKITLYTEERMMMLLAAVASSVAGCFLIAFIFWLATTRQSILN